MVRPAHPDDALAICEIYNHYILHTTITFEEDPLTPDEMRERIVDTIQTCPWFVCEEDGEVLGYCYGRKWRARAAYRHSVEATVYLDASAVGKGRGTALFGALLAELRAGHQFHCVIGGVALPNPASIALLEKFGLCQVAHFREVGRKFDRWIDVAYWQLLL